MTAMTDVCSPALGIPGRGRIHHPELQGWEDQPPGPLSTSWPPFWLQTRITIPNRKANGREETNSECVKGDKKKGRKGKKRK